MIKFNIIKISKQILYAYDLAGFSPAFSAGVDSRVAPDDIGSDGFGGGKLTIMLIGMTEARYGTFVSIGNPFSSHCFIGSLTVTYGKTSFSSSLPANALCFFHLSYVFGISTIGSTNLVVPLNVLCFILALFFPGTR